MLIAGLTGSVAAGKSAVAELWREAGVPVVVRGPARAHGG